MAGFKHFLDGVEVEEPDKFQDFQEEIIRDEAKRILRFNYPLELTFVGDGYEYIESVYQEAYNSEIIYTVIDSRESVEEIFIKAVIKLSNCTFNISALPKHTVDCEIDDNIYQSMVFNNEKRPVSLSGDKSTNGAQLTQITPVELTVFKTSNGANYGQQRTAYDAKDAFAHIIASITNGQVNFESEWYDNLPGDQRIAILTGAELRDPVLNSEAPILELKDLFENLWKKYNLYLIVENPITNPTIRLEHESYLHQDSIVLELKDVEGLKRSMDFEKLYNRVSLGSETYIKELGTASALGLYYIPFLSFVEETYNISGVINVDKELDLVSSYVIDHNVIADTIENGEDSYDEDIFFIQYDKSTNTATKSDLFPSPNPGARFYNEQLLNSVVADRFDFLGEIVLNSGLLEASFEASQTIPINASGGLIYPGVATTIYNNDTFPIDDDSTLPNFDTGNNYDTTSFEFTAPVTGYYRFRFTTAIYINTFEPNDPLGQALLRVLMRFFKNGDTYITPNEVYVQPYNGYEPPTEGGGFYRGQPAEFWEVSAGLRNWLTAESTIFLQVGDTLSSSLNISIQLFYADFALFNLQITDSTYSNPTTPISGGVYKENDPDLYYIGVYSVDEAGLSDNQWKGLKKNPQGKILIDTGNNDIRKTYLGTFKRELISGKTEVAVIFNRKQSIK